jgi:hypothetical protein
LKNLNKYSTINRVKPSIKVSHAEFTGVSAWEINLSMPLLCPIEEKFSGRK